MTMYCYIHCALCFRPHDGNFFTIHFTSRMSKFIPLLTLVSELPCNKQQRHFIPSSLSHRPSELQWFLLSTMHWPIFLLPVQFLYRLSRATCTHGYNKRQLYPLLSMGPMFCLCSILCWFQSSCVRPSPLLDVHRTVLGKNVTTIIYYY